VSARGAVASTRRVSLMATCLCDAFFDDVAQATVEVREHLGCEVAFPEDQTCCSQPAFNAGDWPAARRVARHTQEVFRGDDTVVVPSGSCARMVDHGALLLFENEPDRPAALGLAHRTWELCDFIVRELGVTRWPGRLKARVAFHRSCHSRGTQYAESAMTLLRSIDGVDVVPFGEGEQCCGFGGTFSVGFPHISRAMGSLKIDHVLEAKPDLLVSADASCLMHIGGLADKLERQLERRHVAVVLRDALNEGARPERVVRE
jgi:L-lactate dehydrogenase complex protein LldE